MHQNIQDLRVCVVDFDTMPELPITGLTEIEALFANMESMARGYKHPSYDPNYPTAGKYALALTDAIETGIITEPGKYGIHLVPGTTDYEIHKIIE